MVLKMDHSITLFQLQSLHARSDEWVKKMVTGVLYKEMWKQLFQRLNLRKNGKTLIPNYAFI